jgi:hypothetical protein
VKKPKTKLKRGTRLDNGARVGTCPMCHKEGEIKVESMISVPPAIYVKAKHERGGDCAKRISAPLNVREAALLVGLRPVAIYAAVERQVLKPIERRPGWPIQFEVMDFAAYFNTPDARKKEVN